MALRLSCRLCTLHRHLIAPISALQTQHRYQSSQPLVARFVNSMPSSLQPYLRLARVDRPIGSWLLYIPATWSIALAANVGQFPDFKMLALFGAGAILMRGAGCTVNDMWDKDFDKNVARTRDRPLAAGQLTYFNAFAFLGGQLSLSLCILLQLNWYSVAVGLLSMPLVLSYPLFKRFTYWPQIALGVTFNWGALLGYCAVTGACDWAVCLPLYMAGFNWTMIYDTIYAHQDKEDDMMIGVKSTALLFQEKTKYFLWLFSLPMAAGLTMTGIEADMSTIYFAGVATTMLLMWKQIFTVHLNNPSSCLQHFKSNRNIGLLFGLFIVLDKLFT